MAQAVKSVENATAGVESAAAKAQDVQDAQDAQEVKALFTEKVEELGEAWAATEDKARTIFCAEPSFLPPHPTRHQPAIITLGLYAFISLWIVAGVLKARFRSRRREASKPKCSFIFLHHRSRTLLPLTRAWTRCRWCPTFSRSSRCCAAPFPN